MFGLHFCCCCEWFVDNFHHRPFNDRWSVVSGNWSWGELPDGTEVAQTPSSNAAIACKIPAITADEVPVIVSVGVGFLNGTASDVIRVRLADNIYVRASPVLYELWGNEVCVHQFPVTWESMPPPNQNIIRGAVSARVYGNEVYVSAYQAGSGWEPIFRFGACLGNPIALALRLETETLSPGVTAFFDNVLIGKESEECYHSQHCEGWACGTPSHVYADVNFVKGPAEPSEECEEDWCEGFNGVFELFPGYDYCPPPFVACCWSAVHPYAGALTRSNHCFRYEKIGEGQYRATYHYGWIHTDAGGTCGFRATFSKDYTTPAAIGWSDTLPLTEYVEYPPEEDYEEEATLILRTDEDTGEARHHAWMGFHIVPGDLIDIVWDGGSREGVTVDSVEQNVVAFGGEGGEGEGDDLPDVGTLLTLVKHGPFQICRCKCYLRDYSGSTATVSTA
jgi:hypothetical protein